MIRFRKPEFIPTIAVIFVFGLMMKLAWWQLERLEWKNALLANIEKSQSEPPRPLLTYKPSDLPKSEWKNVVVDGHLLNDKELYATPRYYEGRMGYAVLTPLAFATPVGEQYVLINRGWVSPVFKEPDRRAEGNPKENVIIEGVIRAHFRQEMFRPDNVPAKNLWFWYDLPAMQKKLGLPLLPIMIDASRTTLIATRAPLKDGPKPFPIEISIPNDHLGYAITWFLLGIAAVIMYALYYREKPGQPEA